MNYRKLVIFAITILLIFQSCNKKNELVIMDSPSIIKEEPQNTGAQAPQEEEKPLVQIGPDDKLIIMVRQDGAPGMYLGDDKELHGFYVDLERMVMEEMGQNYELLPYADIGPIILKIKTGEVHSALAAPDLADYRSFLNLSVPYEVLTYVTFIREGDERFDSSTRESLFESYSGKRIGVQAQGHIYQVLREYRDIELIEYPTTTQALEDLDKGILDAVPDVKRIGEYYSQLKGWDITPIGEILISHKITTAFSQALEPSVVERYNKALSALLDRGKVKELYESYFAPESMYVYP